MPSEKKRPLGRMDPGGPTHDVGQAGRLAREGAEGRATIKRYLRIAAEEMAQARNRTAADQDFAREMEGGEFTTGERGRDVSDAERRLMERATRQVQLENRQMAEAFAAGRIPRDQAENFIAESDARLWRMTTGRIAPGGMNPVTGATRPGPSVAEQRSDQYEYVRHLNEALSQATRDYAADKITRQEYELIENHARREIEATVGGPR